MRSRVNVSTGVLYIPCVLQMVLRMVLPPIADGARVTLQPQTRTPTHAVQLIPEVVYLTGRYVIGHHSKLSCNRKYAVR